MPGTRRPPRFGTSGALSLPVRIASMPFSCSCGFSDSGAVSCKTPLFHCVSLRDEWQNVRKRQLTGTLCELCSSPRQLLQELVVGYNLIGCHGSNVGMDVLPLPLVLACIPRMFSSVVPWKRYSGSDSEANLLPVPLLVDLEVPAFCILVCSRLGLSVFLDCCSLKVVENAHYIAREVRQVAVLLRRDLPTFHINHRFQLVAVCLYIWLVWLCKIKNGNAYCKLTWTWGPDC